MDKQAFEKALMEDNEVDDKGKNYLAVKRKSRRKINHEDSTVLHVAFPQSFVPKREQEYGYPLELALGANSSLGYPLELALGANSSLED